MLSAIAGGIWVGASFIADDHVSEQEIAHRREIATRIVGPEAGPADDRIRVNREAVIDSMVDRRVELLKSKSRRAIQKPVMIFFWVSVAVAAILHFVRSDPHGSVDAGLVALPDFISHRIPFMLGRWRLEARDEGGNVILTEVYRTARAAMKSALQRDLAGTVTWDHAAEEQYREYKRRMTEKST